MRTSLKVIVLTVLTLLIFTAAATLALELTGAVQRWLEILHQARVALLVWRGVLYAGITLLWLSLRQKAKQRAQQHRRGGKPLRPLLNEDCYNS